LLADGSRRLQQLGKLEHVARVPQPASVGRPIHDGRRLGALLHDQIDYQNYQYLGAKADGQITVLPDN